MPKLIIQADWNPISFSLYINRICKPTRLVAETRLLDLAGERFVEHFIALVLPRHVGVHLSNHFAVELIAKIKVGGSVGVAVVGQVALVYPIEVPHAAMDTLLVQQLLLAVCAEDGIGIGAFAVIVVEELGDIVDLPRALAEFLGDFVCSLSF